MTANERRKKIFETLSNTSAPVSASTLATQLDVSRQVIVGDIALLRASGTNVSATPRGYVLESEKGGLVRTIACVHTLDKLEDELNVIVDNGCEVLDVIVEHPVYGQMKGELRLASRYDVGCFVTKLQSTSAPPLSTLTNGVHLHTVRCPDEAAFARVCAALEKQGLLFEQE
ncbi:MAG: transcription repressor NadR [Oscillospiraceae bacterium]|nr:transcription repressor NadR [Oscillospiraceae bacterium]